MVHGIQCLRIVLNDKPPSRREILSVISSVYDPLGFAAPFTLPAKKILQDLCCEGVGWDDTIPDQYQVRWAKWLGELPVLEQFKVNRCFKPAEFGTVVSQQIYVFSDASSVGYGSVAYLRLRDDSDRVYCTFLMGKARLAPIKFVTKPRLELTAATVSILVGELLKREVDGDPEFVYHTDSTTVLRYIACCKPGSADSGHSSPSQWKYVDSMESSADDASRGLDGFALIAGQSWLQVPGFLWKPENEWPHQPLTVSQVPDDDPEVKGTTVASSNAVVIDQSSDATNKLINHFSDWHQLRRAVAVFLQVKRTLQIRCKTRVNVKDGVSRNPAGQGTPPTAETAKSNDIKGTCRPLTVQDLVNAELAIPKFVQTSASGEEIHALKEIVNANNSHKEKLQKRKKASIKRNSCIHRLDPFIDNGILRVGGRLKRADLPHETKHPAILPQKAMSLRYSSVMHIIGWAILSEKYWIINVNTAVRHVISKCVFCRRNYSRPNEQKMADLPKNLHRCRLLRTLHHQGRTQGSKTIRRSIHVFSQSSSPYRGGKFR